jgi:hypothetical protein
VYYRVAIAHGYQGPTQPSKSALTAAEKPLTLLLLCLLHRLQKHKARHSTPQSKVLGESDKIHGADSSQLTATAGTAAAVSDTL